MRRAAKIDSNQPEIVEALRQSGCSVQPLHSIGQGCPDLLVANWRGNFCLEVKDGSLPPSHRALTPDQQRWHGTWKAPVHVVTNVDEALKAVWQ